MNDNVNRFARGLLQGLAPDEIELFVRHCKEKSYPDGTRLFVENSEATTLYMILDGGINLHFEMPQRNHADSMIASLKPGDAVGWSAIVPPHVYRLSGYCHGTTNLLEINRDALEKLFESNYHLAYIFMRNIAVMTGERVNQVQDKLARVLAGEAVNAW